MSDQFTIDDEFRDLLPSLADDEYQRLQVLLNRDGCRDPLVIWKEHNILIDGHNRYEICTALDLPFETVEMSFHGRDEVKEWMIRNQLARRNISDAMRVVLNLKLKPVLAAKAKEKQATSTGGSHPQLNQKSDEAAPELNTTKEIAKASGVSHDTVHKVEKVMETAVEPVKDKMLSGDLSINKASQIAALPVGEQPAALEAAMSPPRKEKVVPPEPLTEKQEKSWGAMSEELCNRVRGYAKRYPAAKAKIISDLRNLIKSIEGRQV